MAMSPGRDTTEWRTLIVLICTGAANALGVVLSSVLVQDNERLLVVLGALQILFATVAGVSHSYIKGRSLVKANSELGSSMQGPGS